MDDYNAKVRELYKRRKIISISYTEILTLLDGFRNVKNMVQRKQLPKGYLVRAVWVDPESDNFNFLVIHPSFPIVPEGQIAPRWDEPNIIIKMYNIKEIKE